MKYKHVIRAYCYDRKGNQISMGENNYIKSHPLQAFFANKVGHPSRIYLHAEILAILRAKDKEIYKIKIERIGKKGNLLPSMPCPICMLAIKSFGITQLEYTL